MRKAKKDNYQIDNSEFKIKWQTETSQFIKIDDFVKARSHELHHFTNILRSKTNSKLTH